MKGFDLENDINEVIEPEIVSVPNTSSKTVISTKKEEKSNESVSHMLGKAAADNFGRMVDIASDIVEIQKMKVMTTAYCEKMEADRKMLLDEAKAYVLKKNADTDNIVPKMNLVRLMMQDFYQQSDHNISSEDFQKIITAVLVNMGK